MFDCFLQKEDKREREGGISNNITYYTYYNITCYL